MVGAIEFFVHITDLYDCNDFLILPDIMDLYDCNDFLILPNIIGLIRLCNRVIVTISDPSRDNHTNHTKNPSIRDPSDLVKNTKTESVLFSFF
jgi:hypothetical protein